MKWFKHETDAHTNLKLQCVIDTHGAEAFGFYWICVELVGLQGENFRLKSEKNWKNYLKKFSGLSIEKIETLLTFFSDTKLIDKKALFKGILYIPKLEERQDEYTKKVRRVSGHSPDNIPLEENRRDKKRIEENRRDKKRIEETAIDSPKSQALKFFSNLTTQEEVLNNLLIAKSNVPEEWLRKEINKFVNYWTEPNKSGTKQKWELEKTFEISRRLAKWLNNSQEWNKGRSPTEITSRMAQV